ncbi:MAG: hypothetical protein RLZZ358_712, partial [Bacteroidota bacterium]
MEKKNRKGYCIKSDSDYLCNPFWEEREWEFSSAGSEHLPYKQRVGGSNPSTPTENLEEIRGFFVFCGFGGSPVILRDQLSHQVPIISE